MKDYKNLIRSREARLKILELLSFIPDKPMLKFQYRLKTGRRLNLKRPERFTEKIQWYKLYYKNPLLIQCVDKYEVRDYIKGKGMGDILIPCYGVYESVDDIPWDTLPDSFVMKDTLGGGGASVIVVRDKNAENIEDLKRQAAKWLETDHRARGGGREWPYYSGKKHRVIIEELIQEKDGREGLNDYKFFCFDGKIEFLYVMGDRKLGEKVSVGLFDKDFRELPVVRVGDARITGLKKPENFEEMKKVAEKLAEDFPHVRVDLYDVDNRIYFGELTFYNASGYMKYEPDDFDLEIGRKWKLDPR